LSTANRSIRTSQPMAIESLSKNEKQLDRDIASSTFDPWKYSAVAFIYFSCPWSLHPATFCQQPHHSLCLSHSNFQSHNIHSRCCIQHLSVCSSIQQKLSIKQLLLLLLSSRLASSPSHSWRHSLRLYSLLYIADAGAHAETGQFNCPAQHNKRTEKTATEIVFWKRRNRIRMSANVRAGHIYRPAYGFGRSIAPSKKMFTAVIYLNDGRVSEIPVDWGKKTKPGRYFVCFFVSPIWKVPSLF
jgi:hypothetical protein